MDENQRVFFKNFLNYSGNHDNANSSNSQNKAQPPSSSQIPPNFVFPYPSVFPYPPIFSSPQATIIRSDESRRASVDASSTDKEPETPSSVQETHIPPDSTQTRMENRGLDIHTEAFIEADLSNSKKRNIYVKWDIAEEKLLAQAWEMVSVDSTIGNNQTRAAFWDHVRDYYNGHRPDGAVERTSIHVKNHHCQMLRETNKFVAKFNNEMSQRRSGESDDDIYARALAKYAADEKKNFKYDHVWRVVKDSARFASQQEIHSTQKKTRINESGAYTSSSNPDTSVDADDSESQTRPIGQKAAKRKEKAQRWVKDKVAQGELANIWVDIREQEQEKIRQQAELIRQKDSELQQRDSELQLKHFEMLFKDTGAMNEQQIKDHEKVCQKIRAMYGLGE